MSNDQPDIYFENGFTIYRASALYSCMRSLVATRMGIEGQGGLYESGHGAKIGQIFNEGHLHEPDILERVSKKYGVTVQSQQEPVEIDLLPNIKVRGHIDARTDGNGDNPGNFSADLIVEPSVIEAKALGSSTYKTWLAQHLDGFPRYKGQLSTYMIATGLHGLMAVKDRNTGQMDTQVYTEPPLSISDLRRRVLLIETAAQEEEFPACDYKQFPCAHAFLHEEEELTETTSADDELITMLADEYDRARMVEERAKKKKSELREKLITTLGENGKWENESLSVRTNKAAKKIMDQTLAKKILSEEGIPADAYMKDSDSQTVTVKRKGSDTL